jgi:hypothetical protein
MSGAVRRIAMRQGSLPATIAALLIVPAAWAQPPSPPSQPVSPTPSEDEQAGDKPDTSASTADLRPGMLVKDPSGLRIGTISRIGQTVEGATAVEVDLDGRTVNLSPSILTLDASGRMASSSMTKAEILAADARSPP